MPRESQTNPTNALLLRAIRHEPVPRVPVWLMRQAGRSDPEYQAYRKQCGLDLYTLFRSPEHAVRISLLPRRIGVDAIIMYQDILTLLEPMGAVFRFSPGPVLETPIAHADQVDALRHFDPAQEMAYVGQTLDGLGAELQGELPILGFAGAPFTLAAFLIHGASPMQHMERVIAFARDQGTAFERLIDKLTDLSIDYLNYQISSGAQAVQVFESIGDQIPRDLYERFAQPSHERIFSGLAGNAPGILFVKGAPFLDLMADSGAAVLSVGEQANLGELLKPGSRRYAVQGNVNNRILAEGTPAEVATAVRDCIVQSGGRGHILNLSHGVLPQTPWENVCRFVESAKTTVLQTPGKSTPK